MQKRGNIRCYLPYKLDAQWGELMNIYFGRDNRVKWVDCKADADFVVLDIRRLNGQTVEFFRNTKFIVLCFTDLGHIMLGLRPDDVDFRQATKACGAEFFYLMYECSPKNPGYETGVGSFVSTSIGELAGDDHITLLTLPLGYVSGSKINTSYHDWDTSTYFTKTCKINTKQYEYDWCWIGARSSRDRRALFTQLDSMNGTHKYVVSDMCTSGTLDERAKLLHADNKTVPYDEYIEAHRRSKVCISANGLGMWNYKDGEFFANNCFVLRQHHKNLELNPFSPKDGEHWIVFRNGELKDMIDHYTHADGERENINDAGHEYFKESIQGGWAKEYAGMFLSYLNGNTQPFRKVEYVPSGTYYG
jgi:hypothetical protein